MKMIHHPQNEVIMKLAVGELFAPLAAMVSAHIELCEECRSIYQGILKKESQELGSHSVELSTKELDLAFNLVMNKVNESKHESEEKIGQEEVSVNVSGQLIQLPRSMNFLKGQQIHWKEFGKNNAIAPVVVTPKGNFYLIYMGPGERVPQHNHTGIEYSYVAAGSFEDGLSTFTTGDFSFSTHETTHSPKATSEDGCLVISWVEGRLNYFDGWLKPLNSILWWYLHRA